MPNGLGSSRFARHYSGNHCYFLFLQVLRCFSSLRLPPLRDNRSSTYWVVPFGNLRVIRSFAPNRSLSQLTTSFFASESQGIPLTPLFAYYPFTKLIDNCKNSYQLSYFNIFITTTITLNVQL